MPNNAQQQQFPAQQFPVQQNNVPLFPVQQGPVSFNQPAQISQNFVPSQLLNQMPQQQMAQQQTRQVFGGVYGRRQQHNPIKNPDVFNDDEEIV